MKDLLVGCNLEHFDWEKFVAQELLEHFEHNQCRRVKMS